MLEFDNTTLANMTAALDHGCKSLSVKCDTSENRKRIGEAIVRAARSGKRTLVQFTEVAQQEVEAIAGPEPSRIRAALNRLWRSD